MSIKILGIDLGKNSCSIVGLDANGEVIVRRRMCPKRRPFCRLILSHFDSRTRTDYLSAAGGDRRGAYERLTMAA